MVRSLTLPFSSELHSLRGQRTTGKRTCVSLPLYSLLHFLALAAFLCGADSLASAPLHYRDPIALHFVALLNDVCAGVLLAFRPHFRPSCFSLSFPLLPDRRRTEFR